MSEPYSPESPQFVSGWGEDEEDKPSEPEEPEPNLDGWSTPPGHGEVDSAAPVPQMGDDCDGWGSEGEDHLTSAGCAAPVDETSGPTVARNPNAIVAVVPWLSNVARQQTHREAARMGSEQLRKAVQRETQPISPLGLPVVFAPPPVVGHAPGVMMLEQRELAGKLKRIASIEKAASAAVTTMAQAPPATISADSAKFAKQVEHNLNSSASQRLLSMSALAENLGCDRSVLDSRSHIHATALICLHRSEAVSLMQSTAEEVVRRGLLGSGLWSVIGVADRHKNLKIIEFVFDLVLLKNQHWTFTRPS